MTNIAVVYDWTTDLRSGGPTGYLANLEIALSKSGNSEVEFIVRENSEESSLATLGTPGNNDLVEFHDSPTESKTQKALQDAWGLNSFLSRPDAFSFSDEIREKVLASTADIFHVHTTIDCIKLHNLMTQCGRRHLCKIVLTSHCPELPAREWADVSFTNTGDFRSAEAVYDSYRFVDRLAFSIADAFLFPCEEALAPYEATLTGFKSDFKHKPIYYLPSAAAELKKSELSNPKESFGLAGHFVLSYLGRHNTIKGYDFLKLAGETLLNGQDGIGFLIAGKPEPIEPLDHPRWIEYGWTSAPQDILQASDVFVLPNRLTYFDLVLIEVLSSGRPILAANNGGNRYFANRSAGIILFDNLEDFLEKVQWLQGLSEDERDRMAQENRRLYEADFKLENFGKRYTAVMSEVARDAEIPCPGSLAEQGAHAAISVIVPVYNVEAYLAQCLDSIIRQDHESFEVIVVDDGSTDSCPEILERYKELPNFRIVRQNNAGLSAARNTGLRYATGEFVCFIDSDDYLAPGYLSALHQKCLQDGTDIAFCEIMEFDATRAKRVSTIYNEDAFGWTKWDRGLFVDVEVAANMYPSAWNKLYRTKLFQGLNFPKGLLYEDNPVFFALMMGQRRVSFVNQALYWHRTDRTERISKSSSFRMLETVMVTSLIHSNAVAETHPAVARRLSAFVVQRIFWERFWSVTSKEVEFALTAALSYMVNLLDLEPEWAKRFRDPRIEEDFLETRLGMLQRLTNLPANDRISVVDRSFLQEGEGTFSVGTVQQNQDGSVLLHPDPNGTIVAEVNGLGLYGPCKYEFLLALEHTKAAPTEVCIVALKERVVGQDRLRNIGDLTDWGARQTEWVRLAGRENAVLSLDLESFGPTTSFYIMVKTGEGRADFAWLHLRKIEVTRAAAS